mmetsp:Transcript_26857/g.59181  ORF Transcript_26857/g.59181 Transcript_26857/m.59181 type:complete len:393 (+) Transcript_26857:383-1561(+)
MEEKARPNRKDGNASHVVDTAIDIEADAIEADSHQERSHATVHAEFHTAIVPEGATGFRRLSARAPVLAVTDAVSTEGATPGATAVFAKGSNTATAAASEHSAQAIPEEEKEEEPQQRHGLRPEPRRRRERGGHGVRGSGDPSEITDCEDGPFFYPTQAGQGRCARVCAHDRREQGQERCQEQSRGGQGARSSHRDDASVTVALSEVDADSRHAGNTGSYGIPFGGSFPVQGYEPNQHQQQQHQESFSHDKKPRGSGECQAPHKECTRAIERQEAKERSAGIHRRWLRGKFPVQRQWLSHHRILDVFGYDVAVLDLFVVLFLFEPLLRARGARSRDERRRVDLCGRRRRRREQSLCAVLQPGCQERLRVVGVCGHDAGTAGGLWPGVHRHVL